MAGEGGQVHQALNETPGGPGGGGGGEGKPGGGGKKSFSGDFIVISEFSEVVGPIPLFVIPEWGAEGTFNLNSFVLKIMAVDTQNKSNDPQTYFKDSQGVIPEPSEDAYAYVCSSGRSNI